MFTMAKKPRVLRLPRHRIKLSGRTKHALIIVLAVVLAVLLFIYIYPEEKSMKLCSTEECFIRAANACAPARFRNTVGTTEISYKVGKGCVITKTVTGLGEQEPEQVKELFMGVSMRCNYTRGQFDRAYIADINGNLERCSGPMVNIIMQLRD